MRRRNRGLNSAREAFRPGWARRTAPGRARAERLARLARAVRSGAYAIDCDALAAAMLGRPWGT